MSRLHSASFAPARWLPIMLSGFALAELLLPACGSRNFARCEDADGCSASASGAPDEGMAGGGDMSEGGFPQGGAPANGGSSVGPAGASAGSSDAGAGGDEATGPLCGNGRADAGEDCDSGPENAVDAYGQGKCTNTCTVAPYCGDKKKNGPEVCDEGGEVTDLGACNPECSGYYEKKYIRATLGRWPAGALGGIAGADAKCVAEIGPGWKALLVGGTRRATKTPFLGDDSVDWVIRKYTHYYSYPPNKLIWRTDELALLGVRDGKRVNLYADAFNAVSEYPWSGWRADWTTFDDDVNNQGTCSGWTSTTKASASFAFADLTPALSESCSTSSFILCVEQ